VVGSNLGWDTDYLEVAHGFLHFLQANAATERRLDHIRVLPKSFPVLDQSYHSTLYSLEADSGVEQLCLCSAGRRLFSI
jgi:hypothetical protein